jgi:hypothetical protein
LVVIEIGPRENGMGVFLKQMYLRERLIGEEGKTPNYGFEHEDEIGKLEGFG